MNGHQPMTREPTSGHGVKIVLGVVIGAALAVGAGIAIYGALLASRHKPANATMPDPAGLLKVEDAPVVGELVDQFRPGFQLARCVAVSPAGEVYVTGDFAIRNFDANGAKLSEIDTIEPPGAVAVDEKANVYATFGDEVWVFDASGARTAKWPSRAGALFTSIAVAGDEVYVADMAARCVVRYSTKGEVQGVIGRRNESRNTPGLVIPSPYFDVAAGPDGLLRVANPGRHKIETYSPDGDRGTAWGFFSAVEPGGFVGCCNPANFALVPAPSGAPGEFAGFVTAEKGLARVKVFDAEGKFAGLLAPADAFKRHDELVAARPSGQPFEALDVAAGPDGRIYVLDGIVGELRIYEWPRKDKP